MKHNRIIALFLGVFFALTATADPVAGTVNLKNNGSNIKAEALIDLSAQTVTIGNGLNACIPQYTSGTITIPGSFDINGTTCEVVVGQLAFRLCTSLTEIVIEEGVHRIGDFAFVGCSSLKKVTLPSTLNGIGSGVFVNLSSLTEVVCNATDAPWWGYNDIFAYEGTVEATSKLANQRTLYVPRASANSYRTTKYNNTVGWEDAFGLISEATVPSQELEISTFDELEYIRTAVNNGSNNYGDYTIRLTADLVQEGDTRSQWYSWVPIGTAEHPFMGVFDGGGHVIKNVKTYGAEDGTNVGLFGYTKAASIGNLILQNISLKGQDNVGVVAGTAVNTLIHDILVYDASSSEGTYYCAEATSGNAGGLVGSAENTNVDNCYFYGKVKGATAVGGIVGSSQDIVGISDCGSGYSVECSGSGVVGGIVGTADNSTYVLRSYSRSTLTGSAATKGGIVGQYTASGNGNGIGNCAYLDASTTLPIANTSGEGNYRETGNRRCSTIASMEATNLHDLLGDVQWYYFNDDMNDCPIPKSLAEGFLQWAGLKDADGFIYSAVGNPVSSYTIIGYEGSATEITLPSSFKDKPVLKVANHAFEGTAVTSVTIPDGITTIDKGAFADCADLTAISFGAGVNSDYDGWLSGCTALSEISVAEGNAKYIVEDGVLYNKEKTSLIRCSTTRTGTITLSADVTKIEPGAFANCNDLAVVDMRETTIDWWRIDRQMPNNAFYKASRYTLIILNNKSWASNNVTNEPNVVYPSNSSNSDGYKCTQLLITDRMDFCSPVLFTASSASYDRVFAPGFRLVQSDEEGDAGYEYKPSGYTFLLPFNVQIPYGKGAKLYNFTGVTTEDGVTTVSFTEEYHGHSSGYYGSKGHTTPSYPYFLVVESDNAFTLSTTSSSTISANSTGGSSSHDDYSFVGTTVTIPNSELYDADHAKYILQSDGNWHKVPANQPKAFANAFRCYFRADTTNPAKALATHFGDGDATPINQMVIRTTDDDGTQHYYDLNGRRLSAKPERGLYIYGGKTYISK
ncbi:MAG: leucine-rich repeat protein [Prevotella sp.]|nr:leucine-rich repeat protein [Prevotella sp.]